MLRWTDENGSKQKRKFKSLVKAIRRKEILEKKFDDVELIKIGKDK